MRSLLVFGLLVSLVTLSGCVQNSVRSGTRASHAYAYSASPATSVGATAATVARPEVTEIVYVGKPAPDTRTAEFEAPPAPALPSDDVAVSAPSTTSPSSGTMDPCDPCNPCRPRCKPANPFKRLFCNPCCPPGG